MSSEWQEHRQRCFCIFCLFIRGKDPCRPPLFYEANTADAMHVLKQISQAHGSHAALQALALRMFNTPQTVYF